MQSIKVSMKFCCRAGRSSTYMYERTVVVHSGGHEFTGESPGAKPDAGDNAITSAPMTTRLTIPIRIFHTSFGFRCVSFRFPIVLI